MDSSAIEGAHRDFRVRRSVVHRALNWLITHNQYYRSNHVHIDVNALEQLPHDGNLSQLTSITVESASTEPPATNTPANSPPVADTPATSEDPYSAHLPPSFVSIATRSMTEQEAVHQSVQERQLSPSTSSSPATMMWPLLEEYPSMSSSPKGYMYFSCAFPTLFPTGTGDFSGQRQNQVTIGNYFKHLMMNDANVLIAKHPRFRFFALNTDMRWRALQTGRVYIKQHPGDAQLSLDELRDMVGNEGQTFSNRVSTVSETTKTFLTVICCSQKLACTSV